MEILDGGATWDDDSSSATSSIDVRAPPSLLFVYLGLPHHLVATGRLTYFSTPYAINYLMEPPGRYPPNCPRLYAGKKLMLCPKKRCSLVKLRQFWGCGK